MNPAPLLNQIQRFRRADLLIDANLLVLYFGGARRPDLIPNYKRTRHYTAHDFHLLTGFMRGFRRLRTTPHVLTEASNLLGQFAEPLKSELRSWLTECIERWAEGLIPSKTLMKDAAFPRLGLTDVAMAASSARACVVLTDDLVLAGLLRERGHCVLRLADLRQMAQ